MLKHLGFIEILCIVLAIFKLTGIWNISWFYVLLPFVLVYGTIAIVVLFMFFMCLIGLVFNIRG